jgi:hypothetical protein
MAERRSLPRTIRGGRPVFFADPAVDKVIAMVLHLSSEVWALRERLAALEAIGLARGVVLEGEVDRHSFSAEDTARLDAQRREFIDGLFRVLKSELSPVAAGKPEPVSAGLRFAKSGRRPAKSKAAEAPGKKPARRPKAAVR